MDIPLGLHQQLWQCQNISEWDRDGRTAVVSSDLACHMLVPKALAMLHDRRILEVSAYSLVQKYSCHFLVASEFHGDKYGEVNLCCSDILWDFFKNKSITYADV